MLHPLVPVAEHLQPFHLSLPGHLQPDVFISETSSEIASVGHEQEEMASSLNQGTATVT